MKCRGAILRATRPPRGSGFCRRPCPVFAERGLWRDQRGRDRAPGRQLQGWCLLPFLPTKQAIFEALIADLVTMLCKQVQTAIAREHGALVASDAALRWVIRHVFRHRGLTHLLLVETSGLGPPSIKEVRAARGMFCGIIES